MILHIAKREILHNMLNLRFSLVTILLLSLMAANGFISIESWQKENIKSYNSKVQKSRNELRQSCGKLSELGLRGPGRMYKRPSMLSFIANGSEDSIPDEVACGTGLTFSEGSVAEMWYLVYNASTDRYAQPTQGTSDLMPKSLHLDWAFIIGVLLSLTAIVFTFDSISGEKENGTLALVMSNSVSRSTVLLGKALGAWITLIIPLMLSILVNLAIVSVIGAQHYLYLQSGDWYRIFIAVFISIVYGSIFLMLGFFVSSITSRSATSIFTLLLIWVITVVLLPSALGTVSKKLRPLPSLEVIRRNKQAQIKSIREKHRVSEAYGKKEGTWPPEGSTAWLRKWADYITEQAEQETRFNNENVDDQIAQAELAMDICRASSAAVYQYALESVAGVGILRYKDFVQQVRIHAQQFVDFIKSTDRHDKDSPHIYFVEAGMSQKPVNFDDVPKFEDKPKLEVAFKNAMFDITLLILQVIFLFMCAHVAFLKMDVR